MKSQPINIYYVYRKTAQRIYLQPHLHYQTDFGYLETDCLQVQLHCRSAVVWIDDTTMRKYVMMERCR